MNIKAIWETVEYMEKEPRRIDMIDGIEKADEAGARDIEYPFLEGKRVLLLPPCNTVCCFAGAAVLSHPKGRKSLFDEWRGGFRLRSWLTIKIEATEILELNSSQAARLFFAFKHSRRYAIRRCLAC